MRSGAFSLLLFVVLSPAIICCGAQASGDNGESRVSSIPWQDAGSIGKISSVAEVTVPEGCRFTGRSGVPAFLEATQNLPDPSLAAVLLCRPSDSTSAWFVMFKYDPMGLVREDEKDSLDADKIIAAIGAATDQANVEREERGWSKMFVTGWISPPFYDQTTHNLTWSLEGVSSDGESSANRSVRLLGRGGVVSAELVAEADRLAAIVPQFDQVIGTTRFVSGQSYSEWREGDKVAALGLVALVAGGAGVAAGKLGVFGKLWKLVLAAVIAAKKLVVAAVIGLVALLRGLFRKKKTATAG